MEYDFRNTEKKWQKYWADHKTFRADNTSSKEKYYVLDMFPYPSGAGLHVGHPLGYIASDIFARYKRLKGFNVLHPMGYDSFGLPAEQYAIQTGQHPAITTEQNIKRYREQLDKIGFSFDWEREVRTSNPNYYKWTQWIFIKLFHSWYNPVSDKAEPIETLISQLKKERNDWDKISEQERSDLLLEYRLAYLSDTMVNWCPQLGTVLANEEVKDGVSERGGYPVERKLMKQWSLRISAYADRLLHDLDDIDWTESIKEAQRNWIGKSVGTSLLFYLSPNPSPKERGGVPRYYTAKQGMWEQLKARSNEHRKNQTEAEGILWERVRDRKLGDKIRRQHPVDQFIPDFVCIEKKLIIEVDGGIHLQQKEYDEGRTFMLEEIGYRVIRFTNEEVISSTDWVCNEIKKALSFGEGLGEENNPSHSIEVFTTRPDTIFGVSFVTLAPEHELVKEITTGEQKKAVEDYIAFAKNRSERERMADVKKISGVFTGACVLHPFTGKKIPVWVGDYVLAGYGTGAVMAVPAHDERDFAFATHFGLEKPVVIQPSLEWDPKEKSYDEKEGKLIQSDFLNGLEVKQAIQKAIEVIEEKKLGKGKTNFRLRDAIFGRQRYWGEPIPIYYKDGIPMTVEEKDLPVVLPEIDKFLPTETGEPPLARAKDWKYNGQYEYEQTTMPGWAGSSWYFLRYMDPHNEQTFVSKDAAKYWQNVDLYIGGAEHATGHLLYVRFWTKFLFDLGLIPVIEPAKKLINQGMIQGVTQWVREIRIHESIIQEYKNEPRDLTLIIKSKEGKVLKEILVGPLPKEWHHVYCNYNSELEFEYCETVSRKQIKTESKAYARANIDFNYEVTRDSKVFFCHKIVDWLKIQPSYKPIIVTDFPINAYWNYSDDEKLWRDFNDIEIQDQELPLWTTNPEVEKMSKSKLNVVSPTKNLLTNKEGVIDQHGADCLRLYEMFLGPLEQSKPWNTNGITGVSNFIRKLWRLYHPGGDFSVSAEPASKPELKTLHKTIKKITEDIERFSFNTSVSNFMICVNELTDLKCNKRAILEPLAIMLSPYAPHVAEELWNRLGHPESITYSIFPICKEEYLVESSFNYPVSVNGKTKFFHELELSLSKEDIEKEVMALEQTRKYLEGKSPKKVIVVPNKIVNIVI